MLRIISMVPFIYTVRQKHQYKKLDCVLLVFVIVWVAVVFGINCTSNAGRKIVTVRGAAELLFPACITSAINSKYYSKPYCYKLIQYVCVVVSTPSEEVWSCSTSTK